MLRLTKIVCSTLIIASTMTSAVYSAQTNSNSNNSTETVKSLKGKGYSCGRAGVGMVVCTKGDVTYYCSGSVCEKKRIGNTDRRTRPVFRSGVNKIAN